MRGRVAWVAAVAVVLGSIIPVSIGEQSARADDTPVVTVDEQAYQSNAYLSTLGTATVAVPMNTTSLTVTLPMELYPYYADEPLHFRLLPDPDSDEEWVTGSAVPDDSRHSVTIPLGEGSLVGPLPTSHPCPDVRTYSCGQFSLEVSGPSPETNSYDPFRGSEDLLRLAIDRAPAAEGTQFDYEYVIDGPSANAGYSVSNYFHSTASESFSVQPSEKYRVQASPGFFTLPGEPTAITGEYESEDEDRYQRLVQPFGPEWLTTTEDQSAVTVQVPDFAGQIVELPQTSRIALVLRNSHRVSYVLADVDVQAPPGYTGRPKLPDPVPTPVASVLPGGGYFIVGAYLPPAPVLETWGYRYNLYQDGVFKQTLSESERDEGVHWDYYDYDHLAGFEFSFTVTAFSHDGTQRSAESARSNSVYIAHRAIGIDPPTLTVSAPADGTLTATVIAPRLTTNTEDSTIMCVRVQPDIGEICASVEDAAAGIAIPDVEPGTTYTVVAYGRNAYEYNGDPSPVETVTTAGGVVRPPPTATPTPTPTAAPTPTATAVPTPSATPTPTASPAPAPTPSASSSAPAPPPTPTADAPLPPTASPTTPARAAGAAADPARGSDALASTGASVAPVLGAALTLFLLGAVALLSLGLARRRRTRE